MKAPAFWVGLIIAAAVFTGAGIVVFGSHEPAQEARPQPQRSQTVEQTQQQAVDTIDTEVKEQTKLVTVKRGDTLAKIAKKEDTTVKRLFNANEELEHPDAIEPGDKLRVPEEEEKLSDRYTKVMQQLAAQKQAAAEKRRQEALERAQAQEAAQEQPVASPASVQPEAAADTSYASVWDRLASCESGGNWSINTGNGYYGGLQFSLSSWQAVGGSGYPHEASKSEQIARGEILQSRQGWDAWPSCARQLGLM